MENNDFSLLVSDLGSPDEESNSENGNGDEQFDEEKMRSKEDVFY